MTKAQRIAHKKGNQERKRRILNATEFSARHGRTVRPLAGYYMVGQDGAFTK